MVKSGRIMRREWLLLIIEHAMIVKIIIDGFFFIIENVYIFGISVKKDNLEN